MTANAEAKAMAMGIEFRPGTNHVDVRDTRIGHSNRLRGSFQRALADLHLARRQSAKQLSVWPLLKERRLVAKTRVPVLSLAQALEDGFISIDTSERGHGVSEVHIFNRGRDAVLVVQSEEFPRYDDTLLAEMSALVPPSQGLNIAAHRTTRTKGLRALRESFRCVDDQVGFAAAIGDEIVGVELMSDPDLFVRSYSSLLRPYLVDALSADAGEAVPSVLDPLFEAPESILEDLVAAQITRARRGRDADSGWGRRLEIAGRGIAGSALDVGEIIHLSAYPLEVAWAP